MGAGAGPDDGAPGLAGLKHGISELESAGWCLVKERDESSNCLSF